ncbi:MAG: cobalamin-dependent protein [Planctomycetota bacterium]
MNEQGSFVATLLDRTGRALASGAVQRLALGPLADEVRTLGRRALVADTVVRLEHLAAALATGRCEVLALDFDWLTATRAARGIPPELLRATFAALRTEITENLPRAAATLALDMLDSELPRLATDAPLAEPLADEDHPHVELARSLLAASLSGRRNDAEMLLVDAYENGVPLDALHVALWAAQAEIGVLWQSGEIHVGLEHLASRIAEDALAVLRHRTKPSAASNHSVLVACVPGNRHQIGARIVADRFDHVGWRALFLGANTPSDSLVNAAQDFHVDLVALSVGMSLDLRPAAIMIAALRADAPRVPVLVGGAPFRAVEGLWRDVGADGEAPSATEAAGMGERLLAAI